MTKRGEEIREETNAAVAAVQNALDHPWVADDSGVFIKASDLKNLLRAVKRGDQFAVTVGQYNGIRISALEPVLEKSELWERNREKFEGSFMKDLGFLWSFHAQLSKVYEARQGKDWDELTQAEKDESEAISFLHNWIKLVALQKWDSEAIMRDVQANAWEEGYADSFSCAPAQNPYRDE